MRGDRSKKIVDVGCGIGRHALELARRGYDVAGVRARSHEDPAGHPVVLQLPEPKWLLIDAGFESVGLFAATESGHGRERPLCRDHFEIAA